MAGFRCDRRRARLPRRVLTAVIVLGSAGSLVRCSDPRSAGSIDVPADSAAREVPLRWAGPGGAAVVVPVRINGAEPVDLIIDTGATFTCIDTALARELALPEQRLVGTAVGVGQAGRVGMYAVDSMQIGDVVARDFHVCALDLQIMQSLGMDARGLLGLNVLRAFRVTLDFERGVLELGPPGG